MSRPPLRLGAAGLAAAALISAAPARAEEAPAAADPCADPAPPADPGPPPAARLAGGKSAYEPTARFRVGTRCMRFDIPVSLAGRVEGASGFPLDRYGTRFDPGASVSPEIRVGGVFTSGRAWAPGALLVEAEGDFVTGVAARDRGGIGEGMPGGEGLSTQLRKLHARASLATALHLDIGVQTSHWGMGLVANDGAHGWAPGNAQFVDPRGGDRVLRAQIVTGPHAPAGIALSFGVDRVVGDDIALAGDAAEQMFVAIVAGAGAPSSAGLYVVRRHQENAAGRATDVSVVDFTGKTRVRSGDVVFGLETEWAFVTGSTALGATPEREVHDVFQIGGAARASVDVGAFGALLDFLYASGDQNPSDRAQNGFRVDPNFATGLLLFRQVVAAQTGRGAVTAADPQLVAVPADDLDRVPTRGSATNTVAFFPKLRVRPIAGLEAYGGPLFALANVPMVDAFNSRISGGQRSALGGGAGQVLGVEVDVGVRYRAIVHGAEITAGVEGGALAPGDAFRGVDEAKMGAVFGGRGTLRARF